MFWPFCYLKINKITFIALKEYLILLKLFLILLKHTHNQSLNLFYEVKFSKKKFLWIIFLLVSKHYDSKLNFKIAADLFE
jgi:hypothetical protein